MNADTIKIGVKKKFAEKSKLVKCLILLSMSIFLILLTISIIPNAAAKGDVTRSIDLVSEYNTGYQITYPPTINNDYIYFGNSNGVVYKVSASNVSQEIATNNLCDNVNAAPVVYDNYVYIPCHNGNVYQLNAADLSLVASFSTGILDDGTPEQFLAAPAISSEYIYIGNDNGKLYQLSASNITQEIAVYDTAYNTTEGAILLSSPIQTSPAISQGYVYVASNDGRLYQLNAANISQEIHTYTTTGGGHVTSPNIYNDYLYFGNWNELYQLNALDISQEKIAEYTATGVLNSAPVIANGFVYLGGPDNYIYQLDASDIDYARSGFIAWFESQSPSNFQVTSDSIFFIGSDHVVMQLNSSNVGRRISSTNEQYNSNNIAALDNDIYIGGNNGVLYQLHVSCLENWVWNFTECIDGNQTKEYRDVNNCGTTINLPTGPDGNGTTTECDNIPPVVSFCEEYSEGNLSGHPYNGETFNEEDHLSQIGCAYDSHMAYLNWSIDSLGYSNSFSTSDMSWFANPINDQPDVYYINRNIPAIDLFGSDGKYNLTVKAVDTYGNIGESTISVYYDPTPPNIYFCNTFGGASLEDGAYIGNSSNIWLDVCVNDLTLNDLTASIYDVHTNSALYKYNLWSGEDCSLVPCGFAEQFNPLNSYVSPDSLSDGVYTMQAVATDMAGHESYSEERKFYYDTTSPVFIESNIENNSVLSITAGLETNISFHFNDRTVGSMIAELYYANDTYVDRFSLTNCSYTSSLPGYNFIDDDGITCSMTFAGMNGHFNEPYYIIATYTDGVGLTGQSDRIYFEFGCTENWMQNPTACIDGNQTKEYTDMNNCGTTTSLPSGPDGNGTITACDNTPPELISLTPVDYDVNADFGTVWSDAYGITSTSLTIYYSNGSIAYESGTPDVSGIDGNLYSYGWSFANTELGNGIYSWSVDATDTSGNVGTSNETITHIIVEDGVAFDTLYPEDNATINSSNFTAFASMISMIPDSVVIEVYNSDGVSETILQSTDCQSVLNCSLDVSNLSNGEYYVLFGITNTVGMQETQTSHIVINHTVADSPSPQSEPSVGSGRNSGGGGGGTITPSATSSCKENWKCDAWSDCSKLGSMARNCIDANKCGTTLSKPSTIQYCAPKSGTLETVLLKKNSTALFDIILDIIQEPKKVGENLTSKITLINFGSGRNIEANLTYTITDSKNSVVKQYDKSIFVSTQTEVIDMIDTSRLARGRYTLTLVLKYEGQEYPAQTSVKFNVGPVSVITRITDAWNTLENIGNNFRPGTGKIIIGLILIAASILIMLFAVKNIIQNKKIVSKNIDDRQTVEAAEATPPADSNNVIAPSETIKVQNITPDRKTVKKPDKAMKK